MLYRISWKQTFLEEVTNGKLFLRMVVLLNLNKIKRTRRGWNKIRVWPNAKYFDELNISLAQLEKSLLTKAILLPGVVINLFDEKRKLKSSWCFNNGPEEYFHQL